MVINEKEKTALATSVGADERQSVQNTNNIIPTCDTEINYPDENSSENLEEIYRQMRRMADPYYLHTVSMTELYQTSYKSRPPIIDGLLYGGAYILAGAPKIGKSFLVAQIAYQHDYSRQAYTHPEPLVVRPDNSDTQDTRHPPHMALGRKVITNLDSILKSGDITFPTKVCLVKAMVFPVVMYGCESWTVKKAEC